MLGSSARILAAATAGAAATLTWPAPLRATDEGGQEYSTSAIKYAEMQHTPLPGLRMCPPHTSTLPHWQVQGRDVGYSLVMPVAALSDPEAEVWRAV